MPEVDSYPPGMPCWVDVMCADIGAGAVFYEELFGWRLEATSGGFGMFTLDGLLVAGIGPCPPDLGPVWTTYVSVADVEATLAAAEKAGGHVAVPATDAPGEGRGGVIVDPTGASLSVWEPGPHIGARIGGEPGTRCWSELVTTDVARACAFYADVFGWSIGTAVLNDTDYAVARLGETGIAGFAAPGSASGLPTHWSVTFSVVDCDAAVDTVRRLDGAVFLPPVDVPGVGRFAAVAGPGGERFSVLAIDPAGGAS